MRKGRGYIQSIVVPVSLLVAFACVLPGACTFPQTRGPNEPPSVTINEPASGASVAANGYLHISASASGSNPITRVELWMDGALVGTQESGVAGGISPFDASFELLVPQGQHTLFVRAVNATGLMENSRPVNVNGVEDPSAGEESSSPGTTPTQEAMASPVAPPAESHEPVKVSITAQEESVAANTPVVLGVGWITDAVEQIADFLGSVELVVTLDGQLLPNTGDHWSEAEEAGDADEDGDMDYLTLWRYPVGVLSPGTHRVESEMRLQRPVTDGCDSDGDGVADEYSGTFDWSLQIVVGQ
jgi:hypothetical protein